MNYELKVMKRILLSLTITLFLSLPFGEGWGGAAFAQKQGQPKIDSLQAVLKTAKEDTSKVNTLNAISYEKINVGDYTEARKYADEALALAEKINFKKGIALSYRRIGYIYSNLSDYPKALEYYQKGLSISEQLNDKTNIVWFLHSFGYVYEILSDYPKALEYCQKALTIYEQLGRKGGIAEDLNDIGNVYFDLFDYPKALEYLQKALTINEQSGNKKGIATNLNNIGNIYLNLSDYPKALEYYQKAFTLNEQLGDKNGIATNIGNIGEVYLNLSDYPKALEYMQKGLKIDEEIGHKHGIALSYNNIGAVYQKQSKLNEALKYISKGLSLALEIGAMDQIKLAYKKLAVIDSAMGNFRGAYENHKLFTQYNDSMFSMEKDKKISQLENAKKQVADSVKASDEKKIISAELKQEQTKRYGLYGGLAVMILVAIGFFRQRNKIGKEKKISDMEKKRSDDLLLNILPAEVAEEIKTQGRSNPKTFSMATVMFTDFKDFTAVSERVSGELLVAELDYCFSAFDNIIQKYRVEKIKTVGDSYICASGLPVLNYTHAADMVNAAIEIKNFMLNRKKEKEAKGEIPFEIRIGIHTGPVVAGIVGVKKFAYDIWGDTVNLAARMESSGEAGKINISGSTYQLVKDKFNCVHRGKIQAKNKGEVDMYFVEL
jgi:adenylate cyclase